MVTTNVPLNITNIVKECLKFQTEDDMRKTYKIDFTSKKLKSKNKAVWTKSFLFFLNLLNCKNKYFHKLTPNISIAKKFRKFIKTWMAEEEDWDIEAYGDPFHLRHSMSFLTINNFMQSVKNKFKCDKRFNNQSNTYINASINEVITTTNFYGQEYTRELLGDSHIENTNIIALEIDNHSQNFVTKDQLTNLNSWKEQIKDIIKNYTYRGNLNFTSNRSIYLIYSFDKPLTKAMATRLQQYLHFRLFKETGLIADKHNLSLSKLVHIPLTVQKTAYMENIIAPFIWDNFLIDSAKFIKEADDYISKHMKAIRKYWNLKVSSTVNSFNETAYDISNENIIASDMMINVVTASQELIDRANRINTTNIVYKPRTLADNTDNYYKMLNNPITLDTIVSPKLQAFYLRDINRLRVLFNAEGIESQVMTFNQAFQYISRLLGPTLHLFFDNPAYGKCVRSQIKFERKPSMQLNQIYNRFSNTKLDYVYHYNDYPSGSLIDMVMWVGKFASENKSYNQARDEVIHFLAEVLNITIEKKKPRIDQLDASRLNFDENIYHKHVNELISYVKMLYAANRRKSVEECKELADLTTVANTLFTSIYPWIKQTVSLNKDTFSIQFLRTSEYLLQLLHCTNIKNNNKLSRLLNLLTLTKIINRVEVYEKIDPNIRVKLNQKKNVPYIFSLTNFDEQVEVNGEIMTRKEYIKIRISQLFKQEKNTKSISRWTNTEKIAYLNSLPTVKKITINDNNKNNIPPIANNQKFENKFENNVQLDTSSRAPTEIKNEKGNLLKNNLDMLIIPNNKNNNYL